jgi:hypothetical protein
MASHMKDTPPRIDALRSDVSEEMGTLVARCLEKNPARRPSAQEIVYVLVPGQKQVVEWPPPGMSRVRRVGARLLASVAWVSVSVAVFFAMIALWPDIAILQGTGVDSSLLRSFSLGASIAIIFALATFFVFYALLALQRWRWAVSTGYPPWVIADVLSDARRDTGHLINGTADFTLVAGPTRRLLLAMRRARLLLLVLAALIALAGVSHWVVAWLLAAGSQAAQSVAIGWAIPILAAYLLFFLAGIPEQRVRRRERARSGGPTSQDAPPPRGELVKMWMASAERARKSLSGQEK